MAYALGSLLNVCSSATVLWRFWKDPEGEGHYFELTRRRERRASVGVGFTFVAIGIATFAQAVAHLRDHRPPTDSQVRHDGGSTGRLQRAGPPARRNACWHSHAQVNPRAASPHPSHSQVLLSISSVSMFVLSWSCVGKLYLAATLQSTALRKDAIVSGACAAMAAGVLFSTAVHREHPRVWWLDATVALLVSLTLPLLGVQSLTRNRWWDRAFWSDVDLPPEEKVGQAGGMLPGDAAELGHFARMLHDQPISADVELHAPRR